MGVSIGILPHLLRRDNKCVNEVEERPPEVRLTECSLPCMHMAYIYIYVADATRSMYTTTFTHPANNGNSGETGTLESLQRN